MALTLTIGDCIVVIDDDAHTVVTRFMDGVELLAIDDPSQENVDRAHEIGYPDTWGMNRHHDLVHSFLADREGKPFSPTLYHACHPDSPIGSDPEERAREECKVLEFQRFVMSGDNRWECIRWLGRDWDMDELARDFLALMGR